MQLLIDVSNVLSIKLWRRDTKPSLEWRAFAGRDPVIETNHSGFSPFPCVQTYFPSILPLFIWTSVRTLPRNLGFWTNLANLKQWRQKFWKCEMLEEDLVRSQGEVYKFCWEPTNPETNCFELTKDLKSTWTNCFIDRNISIPRLNINSPPFIASTAPL